MKHIVFDGLDEESSALEAIVGELAESQREANRLKREKKKEKGGENVGDGSKDRIASADEAAEIAAVGICTHTNKVADPRIPAQCAVQARYGQLGDLNVASVSLPFHKGDPSAYREIVLPVGAASIPAAKVLITEYTLKDGDIERDTNLLEAIVEGRPAGDFARKADRTPLQAQPHGLEKVVLVPESRGPAYSYVAMLPKTPAWLRPAASHAAHEFVIDAIKMSLAEQIGESIKEKRTKVSKKGIAEGHAVLANPVRVPSVKLNCRFRKVLKPQNASLRFGSGRYAGWVIQNIFVPPQVKPSGGLARKAISRWVKEGAYRFEIVRDAILHSVDESVLFNAVSYQKHRQQGSDIRGSAIESNRGARDAFVEYGEHVGSIVRELFKHIAGNCANDEIASVCNMILRDHEDPYGVATDAWNTILKEINSNNLIDSASKDFLEGFSSSMWFDGGGKAVDAGTQGSPGRVPSVNREADTGREDKFNGRHLIISMDVSGHDAGSAGVTIGPPAPTAIYGFLHNILERQAGLKIERFLPVIKKTIVRDGIARRYGVYGALSHDARKAISNAAEKTPAEHVADAVSKALAENGAFFAGGHIVGCTASAINDNEAKGKAPFVQEVKADTRLTLVVNLSRPVDVSSVYAEGFLNVRIGDFDLSAAIGKARLAGGQIRLRSVRAEEGEPQNLRGFALTGHSPSADPLQELFRSSAFVNREYAGRKPIGYLACGYEGIQEAPDVSRKGETFKALHAETIYKAFSYCGANNQGRKWFKPRTGTSADNLFFFQLI